MVWQDKNKTVVVVHFVSILLTFATTYTHREKQSVMIFAELFCYCNLIMYLIISGQAKMKLK